METSETCLSLEMQDATFYCLDEGVSRTQSNINIGAFFISNTFISNAKLKLAKNQANAKQHPETELLLFENYSHSSSTFSSKNNGTF